MPLNGTNSSPFHSKVILLKARDGARTILPHSHQLPLFKLEKKMGFGIGFELSALGGSKRITSSRRFAGQASLPSEFTVIG